MKSRLMTIIVLLISTLIMTGCWDSVEIDRKAFVSTIAIDMSKDEENPIVVTYSFPDIRNMDAEKGISDRIAMAVDGHSVSDAYLKADSMTSRSLHMSHSKLMIISEDLYGDEEIMERFMDYLERSPNINRAMNMVLVEGKASDYVGIKPLFEDGIDGYMVNILVSSDRNGSIKPVTVTDYLNCVKSDERAIVPTFIKKGDQAVLTGGDVVYRNRILGELSIEDMDNISLISGHIGGCRKFVSIDGKIVDYYIRNVDKKLRTDYDETLKLNYVIRCDGELSGYFDTEEDIDSEKISEIEAILNQKMEGELLETVNKYKNIKNVDILNICPELIKYHGRTWDKIKDDPDAKVSNATVLMTVENKITSIGISN